MAAPKSETRPTKLGLSQSALALVFSDLPHALDGQTLTVTYPSLAVYAQRAQADMTALGELADVRASHVCAASSDKPSEYQDAAAPVGPQRLTVTLA